MFMISYVGQGEEDKMAFDFNILITLSNLPTFV
jgi:hypothetical protein